MLIHLYRSSAKFSSSLAFALGREESRASTFITRSLALTETHFFFWLYCCFLSQGTTNESGLLNRWDQPVLFDSHRVDFVLDWISRRFEDDVLQQQEVVLVENLVQLQWTNYLGRKGIMICKCICFSVFMAWC